MAAPHRPEGTDGARTAREMYKTAYDLAWRTLTRLGVAKCDRDELAQRVVIRAYASRSQYSPERGTLEHWILGIARNEARLFRRAESRKPESARTDVEVDTLEGRGAEERMDLDVESVWASIPELERNVVWLRVMGEFTFAEIAEVEGISKSQADRLYKAGLARLRAAIGRSQEQSKLGIVAPLTMGALFDLSHAPGPPPDVVERSWQRAARELGIDTSDDAEVPSERRGPVSANPPSPSEGDSMRPHRLAKWLGPILGTMLGAIVSLLALQQEHQPEPVRAAATVAVPAGVQSGRVETPLPVASVDMELPDVPVPRALVPIAKGHARQAAGADRERSIALVQRGREALEGGDPAAAAVAFSTHARDFSAAPEAALREQLWAVACERLRQSHSPIHRDAIAGCSKRP